MKSTARRRRDRSTQLSLDAARRPMGRGGWRPGAGRPAVGRTTVLRGRRERFAGRYPVHVTLRVLKDVGRLRREKIHRVIKRSIALGGHRDDFRVVHYSVQGNHLHFVIESDGAGSLARGMQGLEVRLARRMNRVLGRRGKLFADRYHVRVLRSPREVRFAIRYVLLNARHHSRDRLARTWIYPFSSAAWFDGWRDPIRADEPWMKALVAQHPCTAEAREWLLTTGWRRWGPLVFDEIDA